MNATGQSWLLANQKNFSAQHLLLIRNKMEQMDDEKIAMIAAAELKDPTMMMVVALLGGWAGIHRFMLGDTGMGILMLLTGGVCGVLWFIDLFSIQKTTQEYNFNQLVAYL